MIGLISEWMLSSDSKELGPYRHLFKKGIPVSPLMELPELRRITDAGGWEMRGADRIVKLESNPSFGTWTDTEHLSIVDGVPLGMDLEPSVTSNLQNDWSRSKKFQLLAQDPEHPDLPEIVTSEGEVYQFLNDEGMVIFVQQRVQAGGMKLYVPWTPMLCLDDSSFAWHACEPPGPLPLFGAHRLAARGAAGRRIIVHEGARTALAAQRVADGEDTSHPWFDDLKGTINIGWSGGSLAASYTNWAPVNKSGAEEVIIVPDHDEAGDQSIAKISRQLHLRTSYFPIDARFPEGWDVAEPFPPSMFEHDEDSGVMHYTGPMLMPSLMPGTWATELCRLPSGKAGYRIRRSFAKTVFFVIDADMFGHTGYSTKNTYAKDHFSRNVRRFSDVKDTAELVLALGSNQYKRLTYRPDRANESAIIIPGTSEYAYNLYVPSSIRAAPGDVSLFEDFLANLIPDSEERHQLKRWVATLIARPEIRMIYSLLLMSHTQGMGKNTLTDYIIKPLIGSHNVSTIDSNVIGGAFNGWLAKKRMVIVPEIYSGHSKATYNALKSVLTDPTVLVNEKFQKPYEIDNWAVVVACSNAEDALMIEPGDRRWFMPTVGERRWPLEKFYQLHDRLKRGDLLRSIMHWAETFGDYVRPGEMAPMSVQKETTIDAARTSLMREAEKYTSAVVDVLHTRSGVGEQILSWLKRHKNASSFDMTKKEDISRSRRGNAAARASTEIVAGRLMAIAEEMAKIVPIDRNSDENSAGMPVVVDCGRLREVCMAAVRDRGERGYTENAVAFRAGLKDMGMIVPKARSKVGDQLSYIAMNKAAEDLIAQVAAPGDLDFDRHPGVTLESLRSAAIRLLMVEPSQICEPEMIVGGRGGGWSEEK